MDNIATIISVIVALCAIISPILVSIINNHHNLKMKKIELTKEHRIKAIENYAQTLESFYQFSTQENRLAYESALGKALLYVPSKIQKTMIEIDKQLSRTLKEDNQPSLADEICLLCALLQKEIDI